jgi:hypothetical protein
VQRATTPARPYHPVLTDGQKAELNDFIEKRFRNLTRTEPVNRSELERSIKDIYAFLKLKSPQVVFCDSPYVGKFTAIISACVMEWRKQKTRLTSVYEILDTFLNKAFIHKAYGTIYSEMYSGNHDYNNFLPSGWDREDAAVNYFRLEESISPFMGIYNHPANKHIPEDMSKVSESMLSAVSAATNHDPLLSGLFIRKGSMLDKMHNWGLMETNSTGLDPFSFIDTPALLQIKTSLDPAEERLFQEFVFNCLLWYHSSSEVQSYGNARSQIRMWMGKHLLNFETKNDFFDQWLAFHDSCPLYFLHEDFVVVIEFPETMRLNDRDRFHSEHGPAIRWRDGFALYAIDGVFVKKQIVESPETLTVSQIVDEPNAEVRRVMLSRFGEERFIRESKATVLDDDERFGTLMAHSFGWSDEALVMVKVKNSTPESDGSYKHYYLRVPPTMRTAREAVAWTFQFSPNEYDPDTET